MPCRLALIRVFIPGRRSFSFSAVNVVKLVPYAALGQFNTATLTSALVLLPLAVGSTLLGARIVKHLRAEVFLPADVWHDRVGRHQAGFGTG